MALACRKTYYLLLPC